MFHRTFIILTLLVTKTDSKIISTSNEKCSVKATSPICYEGGDVYPNFCFTDKAGPRDEAIPWSKCNCGESNNFCTDNKDPVCGSDGNTYISRCDLLTASCKSQGVLYETNHLPPLCKVQDCPEMAIQPVCSCTLDKNCNDLTSKQKDTFLKLYPNPCIVGKNKTIEIIAINVCTKHSIPQGCHSRKNICGNNMKIYKDLCEFLSVVIKLSPKKIFEVPMDYCCKKNALSPACLK